MKNQSNLEKNCNPPSDGDNHNLKIDLNKLLDNSQDVICSFDKEGRFLFASAAAYRIWGYQPEELIGQNYIDFVAPEDQARTLASANAFMAGDQIPFFENEFIRKDGTRVPLFWTCSWDSEDQICYGSAKNVLEQKKAEMAAKLNTQRLERAYIISNLGWWEWDAQKKVSTASDELYKIYGLDKNHSSSVSQELYLSLVHPDDLETVKQHIEASYQHSSYEYEHRLVKPSGEIVFLLQRTESFRDQDGTLVWMHGTTKDITSTKATQLRLEKSEQKLIKTLESIQDGFFSIDQDWIVTYWNKKAEELLGKKREEIIGKNLWDEYKEAITLKFYSESLRAASEKTIVSFEEYFPPLNMWIEVNIYPSEEGLSVYFKNINKKKLKEAERQQFQAKVEEQHQMMVEVLEQMQDGFMTLSLTGKIIYWNRQAEQISSIPREAVLDKSIWDLYPGLEQTPFYQAYQRLLNNPTPVEEEALSPFTQKWIKLHAYRTQNGVSVFFRDTTAAKKAESELQRLSLIAEKTSNIVWLMDTNRRITWINNAFTGLTGYTHEEAVGRLPNELFTGPDTDQKMITTLPKNFDESKLFTGELINYTKSNEKLYVQSDCHSVLDSSGKVLYYFVTQTDITALKKAEEKIKEKESQLQKTAEVTPDALVIYDLQAKQPFYINDLLPKWTGYASTELLEMGTKGRLGLIHPDDQAAVLSFNESFPAAKDDEVRSTEYRFRTKQGQYIWLNNRAKVFKRDLDGKATHILSVIQEVTEQKKAADERHKLSLIAKQTSNAVSILDTEMRIQWVNEAYKQLYGYAEEEVIGRKPSELVSVPKEAESTIALFHQHFKEGKPIRYELTCFTKKGRKLILDIDAQPVLNSAGKVLYYFVLKTDVTERKLREQELQRLSLIAKETTNAVTLVDLDGTISWVNEAFTNMFGYTRNEVIGNKNSTLLIGPETDTAIIKQMFQGFEQGLSFKGEIIGYTKTREKVWLETYGQPLLDEEGRPRNFFIMHNNITKRKSLEEKLEQQRKKTTADVIAAQERERAQVGRELHDNVNQVLTSVKLYQDLMLSGVGVQQELMNKSSRLLQNSINEIRNLSKMLSAPTLGNIRLKDSVKELVDTIAATNKFSVTVDVSAVEELEVEQDLHLAVYRILQEQLTNILKYAEASEVSVLLDFLDGNLVLKVSDNGHGFDMKQKRSGIGITNMRQRAESLNGMLSLNSAPGLGCVLIATFPLLDEL